jgi:hypothetical protein
MNEFEAYCEYVALKTHFAVPTYDYFRAGGKTKGKKVSSYEKRHDKQFFRKLAKRKDVVGFLVANLLSNDSFYVGECVFNESSETVYRQWRKRIESISYLFKNDLGQLGEDFDSLFRVEDTHPPVLRKYLRGEIHLETLVILIDLARCMSAWDRSMNDPLWKSMRLKIVKYKPFLKYDRAKLRSLVLETYK